MTHDNHNDDDDVCDVREFGFISVLKQKSWRKSGTRSNILKLVFCLLKLASEITATTKNHGRL